MSPSVASAAAISSRPPPPTMMVLLLQTGTGKKTPVQYSTGKYRPITPVKRHRGEWVVSGPGGDACVPGFGCGLARESVGGVGFEVGICEVLVSVSCVSRLPPVSLNR